MPKAADRAEGGTTERETGPQAGRGAAWRRVSPGGTDRVSQAERTGGRGTRAERVARAEGGTTERETGPQAGRGAARRRIPPRGRNIALFDLDGTLTDPAVGITASFRHGLAAVGIDPAAVGPLERFIGPPLQESFAWLGLDADGVTAAIAGYREYFGGGGLFENVVYEGIAELLAQMCAAGWILAIATSKPEPFANAILEHFDLARHFAFVAGATMDGSRRHKAEVIAHALGGVAATSEDRVVMIGDREVDISGAKRNGIGSIGVVWGYGSVEELIEAAPDALAAGPDEIAELLGVSSLTS